MTEKPWVDALNHSFSSIEAKRIKSEHDRSKTAIHTVCVNGITNIIII